MNASECTVVTYGVAPAEWWLRRRARQFSVRGGERQSVQPRGLPLMLITLHEQSCSLQQACTYRGIKHNAFIKIPNYAGSLCCVSAMSLRLKYLSLQLQSCRRFNTYSTDILTHSAKTCTLKFRPPIYYVGTQWFESVSFLLCRGQACTRSTPLVKNKR